MVQPVIRGASDAFAIRTSPLFLLPAVRRCPRFTFSFPFLFMLLLFLLLSLPLSLSYCKLTACPTPTDVKQKQIVLQLLRVARQTNMYRNVSRYVCMLEVLVGMCGICAVFRYRSNSGIFSIESFQSLFVDGSYIFTTN